jgi:hypothetical protein
MYVRSRFIEGRTYYQIVDGECDAPEAKRRLLARLKGLASWMSSLVRSCLKAPIRRS